MVRIYACICLIYYHVDILNVPIYFTVLCFEDLSQLEQGVATALRHGTLFGPLLSLKKVYAANASRLGSHDSFPLSDFCCTPRFDGWNERFCKPSTWRCIFSSLSYQCNSMLPIWKKKTCLKKNILAALDLACFSERVLPFHQPPAEIWKYGRNEWCHKKYANVLHMLTTRLHIRSLIISRHLWIQICDEILLLKAFSSKYTDQSSIRECVNTCDGNLEISVSEADFVGVEACWACWLLCILTWSGMCFVMYVVRTNS